MSRQEAVEQYNHSLKAGQKYYKTVGGAGGYPYPLVLDDILDESSVAGRISLGLVNIPSDLIVGTVSSGRVPVLAGSFMPLAPATSEFAAKWISLCEAHLSDEGLRDPIKCFEYMGKFYIQEGNKRTSVLKSYDATSIPGMVTRIIPEYSDDHDVQVYYEFMRFYQLSRSYLVRFRHRGQYARFQAELGFDPDYEWNEDQRRSFSAGFAHFSSACEKVNSANEDITVSEALLVWLQVFTFADIKSQSAPELVKSLTTIWPDIRAQVREFPIEVSTEPAEKDPGIISKLLGVGRIDHVSAAFIYGFDPQTSAWTRAHEHGREYLQERLGSRVSTKVYYAGGRDYYGAMSLAVSEGADLIFATTPTMIDACRRIAAENPGVKVLNCSLSQPYTGVRTYYSRIYEGKFITGAVAGAMAETDTVGYVANYPIIGVPANINAFALGVQLTNPRARVKLLWSCCPGDPLLDFVSDGITVISNREATNTVNPHWALEWGTYKLHSDGSLLPLAVPCWDWGPLYEKIVMGVLSGSWTDSLHAINYWWGLDSGVVGLQLSPELPDGVRALANILRDGIVRGYVSAFSRKITDQQGIVRCDGNFELSAEEIMGMDWLCENVDGKIPGYDELLPQSREVVRLLGIYRDSIPPEKEEAQL
ncbi:MAG: BMP family ABC transporter substrate-binding protein [Candidatus Limivicinus sp.]|jgi:basic membrane protein A